MCARAHFDEGNRLEEAGDKEDHNRRDVDARIVGKMLAAGQRVVCSRRSYRRRCGRRAVNIFHPFRKPQNRENRRCNVCDEKNDDNAEHQPAASGANVLAIKQIKT